MRPLRPKRDHRIAYPNVRQAAASRAPLGAAVLLGVCMALPATAFAGPPPDQPTPRMGGRRPSPNPVQPQTDRVFSFTVYLSDGSYAGVQVRVTPTLVGDISYLNSYAHDIERWVTQYTAPTTCQSLDLSAMNGQLLSYLNSLDPTASYAVGGVTATLQFCEWGGPVDGDMVAPEYF